MNKNQIKKHVIVLGVAYDPKTRITTETINCVVSRADFWEIVGRFNNNTARTWSKNGIMFASLPCAADPESRRECMHYVQAAAVAVEL